MSIGARKKRRGNRSRESVLRAAVHAAERRRVRRRRLGLVLALLLGVPALAYAAALGTRAGWNALFAQNDFFLIRRIEITTDGTLGADHVREYGRVSEGVNLFRVDPAEIRDLLLEVPVVAGVQVARRLPDTLLIDIAERVAVARLGLGGSAYAVDAEGHVMGPGSARPGLPAIVGVRDADLRPGDVVEDGALPAALRLLELCGRAEMRREIQVETIDVGHADRLDIGLASGERLLLSRTGFEEKLRQFPLMRTVARERGLDLVEYDMTLERNYVGRPAEPAPEPEARH